MTSTLLAAILQELCTAAERQTVAEPRNPFAAAAAVPLSSIRQPSRMIGRTALRILLEEASDSSSIPRQTVFPPELVIRRSTTG